MFIFIVLAVDTYNVGRFSNKDDIGMKTNISARQALVYRLDDLYNVYNNNDNNNNNNML